MNAKSWSEAVRACELAVGVAHEHIVWQFEEGSLLAFLALAYLGGEIATRRRELPKTRSPFP